jgi:hypothetical protein
VANPNFAFKVLCEAVEQRGLQAVLNMYRVGQAPRLRIEVVTTIKQDKRIIDYENVMPKESVDKAARRLLFKMKDSRKLT